VVRLAVALASPAECFELRDEFITVLFDGRVETLAVPADSVRKVSTRQS
jgi:hypothetical protein